MAVVSGDRYLDRLVRFVDKNVGPLLEGATTLKLNPSGLHYVHSRLEALRELEGLIAAAPVDYLRAYVSDLGDHRALEQLRRILKLLTSVKVVSVLAPPDRDPTPLSLLTFGRLKVLELRGCDLSTMEPRGLLDLRHTLEKLICHNSTDALRHVFASRIVDIKNSPVWSRLSFVSCACNGFVLMDESLQLLPAVETLDLSRNKFAKADNLRKCMKLQHLDLGFNHLRTVASLSEVLCPIVKLDLRNNALTTLHGIENLKEVEGIDLSYNIISNFAELEVLSRLSSLKRLWLEGNPVCCTQWYRAHIFSFFRQPDKLELDGKEISTREYWEMQAILTSRHKRPARYGFYFPATDDTGEDSVTSTNKKRHSRVACIDEEQVKLLSSETTDQDSVSCDGENLRKDDNIMSDSEAEIMELINRVEAMKKERSVLWLRDFREWLDATSVEALDGKKIAVLNLDHGREVCTSQGITNKNFGESSTNVESLEIENGINISESAGPMTGTYECSHGSKCIISNGKAISQSPIIISNQESNNELKGGYKQYELGTCSNELSYLSTVEATDFVTSGAPTTNGGGQLEQRNQSAPLTAFENIVGSRSSSICPGSPPQYKEDILHRCQNLDDEFLQLSSESYSLASSDSDTSCSDDDSCRFSNCFSELNLLKEAFTMENMKDYSSQIEESHHHERQDERVLREDDSGLCTFSEQASGIIGLKNQIVDNFPPTNIIKDESNDAIDQIVRDDEVSLHSRKTKWKPKKRFVSLSMIGITHDKDPLYHKSNGILEAADFGISEKY